MQLVNGKMLSNRNARVRMDVIELRGFGNRLEEAIEKMKKWQIVCGNARITHVRLWLKKILDSYADEGQSL